MCTFDIEKPSGWIGYVSYQCTTGKRHTDGFVWYFKIYKNLDFNRTAAYHSMLFFNFRGVPFNTAPAKHGAQNCIAFILSCTKCCTLLCYNLCKLMYL